MYYIVNVLNIGRRLKTKYAYIHISTHILELCVLYIECLHSISDDAKMNRQQPNDGSEGSNNPTMV